MLGSGLGLAKAGPVSADQRGLLWFGRCALYFREQAPTLKTAGFGALQSGEYKLKLSGLRAIMLGPGSTVSHDMLEALLEEGTRVVCVGENGVRYYASIPYGGVDGELAKRQAEAWADADGRRMEIARRMYAWRLGEVLPAAEIAVLRGIEGARARKMYEHLARQHGVQWGRRKYDRADPESADAPNQAINHASSAVEAAASIAIAVAGALPQLGFIHEDSANSFALDLADLLRDEVTVPCAFMGVREHARRTGHQALESVVRRLTGQELQRRQAVGRLIDKIYDLFSP